MKYKKFKEIVEEKALILKENAGYSGAWDDGGSKRLLDKLEDFEKSLIIKYDLRPSEINKLSEIEIGEPNNFSKIIEEYKISLAKKIKL